MKPLYLIILSCHILLAAEGIEKEERVKDTLTIGGGGYIQSQPYEGADPMVTPTPVIFFDNSLFYIRWVRMGMYFAGEKKENYSWGASITLQPRPFGYKPKDATILNGMDERETSWEAGLALAFKHEKFFFETILVHDVLDRSNGSVIRAELGTDYKTGDWSFYPSILAVWHSNKFNDYYYGVNNDESSLFRPAYTAKADIDYAAQTYINYAFNKHWNTLINLRADYLSAQIRHSPVVDDNLMLSGMVSLIYNFEY